MFGSQSWWYLGLNFGSVLRGANPGQLNAMSYGGDYHSGLIQNIYNVYNIEISHLHSSGSVLILGSLLLNNF